MKKHPLENLENILQRIMFYSIEDPSVSNFGVVFMVGGVDCSPAFLTLLKSTKDSMQFCNLIFQLLNYKITITFLFHTIFTNFPNGSFTITCIKDSSYGWIIMSAIFNLLPSRQFNFSSLYGVAQSRPSK